MKEEAHHHDHSHGHHQSFKATLGLLWGGALLVMSFLKLNIPFAAEYSIIGLTSLVTVYLGKDVYISAFKSLFQKKEINMDVLYSISTLTILGVSILSTFVPGLPMITEAAPMVLGFRALGEVIEDKLRKKLHANTKMTDRATKFVLRNNKKTAIEELNVNDEICLAMDEVIPVNGFLLKEARLFTTLINGSPFPKKFTLDKPILAGMRVGEPKIQMRVTHTFKESHLSRIDQHLEKASKQKAPIEVATSKMLNFFVPGLLGIATISGLLVGFLVSPAAALECGLSVLVSACPCTLKMITPLAISIGMSEMAKADIYLKSGADFQAATELDFVLLDLNGTLTTGKPKVTELKMPDRDFLHQVALLERQSDHAIAELIVNRIEEEKDLPPLSTPLELKHLKIKNNGVEAMINGERVMVGNKKMLEDHKIFIPEEIIKKGKVYVVRGDEIVGEMVVEDPLRPDAKETVQALKALKKEVYICTGADELTAHYYAEKLKIRPENVFANCQSLEEKDVLSKPGVMKKLQANRKKGAAIGDAGNDAHVVKEANLGIAMQSAISDVITEEKAGMVIKNESISSVAKAIMMAEKTKKTIYQNLKVSLVYNSLVILISAGLLVALGHSPNPAIGVGLMIFETIFVFGNTYRLKNHSIMRPADSLNEIVVDNNSTRSLSKTLGARPKEIPLLTPSAKPAPFKENPELEPACEKEPSSLIPGISIGPR